MNTPYQPLLSALMRVRGVTGCLLVDAQDGIVIDSVLQFGMRGDTVAALMASLFQKARQSATAAGIGAVSVVQLEAERGRVCAAGKDGLVLVAVAELRVNIGLLRVEMLRACEAL